MPDALNNDLPQAPQPLTRKEVVKCAITSGGVGLVLFALGLAAIVLVGFLGILATSGTWIWGVAVGLGCVLLMIPSALVLGIGIQCLRLSVVGIYSLIVGKPVYGFTVVVGLRRNCPDSK